jgi:hypothetical protein
MNSETVLMNFLQKTLLTRAKYRIARRFYLDLGADERDTMLIAGAGRSGTTWLGELVNATNRLRTLFEPFSRNHLDDPNFHVRQYINTDSDDALLYTTVRRILCGRTRGQWIDRYNKRILAQKRLIKAIHANLFLNWIHVHFPKMPIVYVIRHPCAVALSRVQCGWNAQGAIADLLDQQDLVVEHLEPMLDLIQKTSDPFESHIIMWAVENAIPLSQFSSSEIHIVSYEDVLRDPQGELDRIFHFVKLEQPTLALDKYHTPSCMTNRDKKFTSGPRKISQWREHVSRQMLDRANGILAHWQLDSLYGCSDILDKAALTRYMRKM